MDRCTPSHSRAAASRTSARRVAGLLLLPCVVLLIVYLAIDTVAVMRLTLPARHEIGANPASNGVDFVDITFTPRADDTITLKGWFMPNSTSERAVVVVHGFGLGGCRTCGFNKRLGTFAEGLQQRGFNVLVFDLRGHGQSSDARYTFGLREKRDVEGAVDWLLALGFRPGMIGVLGESMGGAASIFAAAEEPAIGALVTDSTFADLNQVLEVEFPKRSGLPAFFVPGAYLMGRLITGENLSDARPVAQIGRIAPRPILLIHGDADAFIPSRHVQLLAQSAPSAEVWLVSGANHVEAYQRDPEAYTERISAFFLAGLHA